MRGNIFFRDYRCDNQGSPSADLREIGWNILQEPSDLFHTTLVGRFRPAVERRRLEYYGGVGGQLWGIIKPISICWT